MENEGPMATPARVRTVTFACGATVLFGGLLALVGMFLPWAEDYYPDWNVVGNPSLPGAPIFHVSPMSIFFHNPDMGMVCGAVFLAPPLVLVARGLLVCATRRWRATGAVVAATCAGLAVTLLAAWLYFYPVLPALNDIGTRSRPDVGLAVVALSYVCALAAGIAGGVFGLDG